MKDLGGVLCFDTTFAVRLRVFDSSNIQASSNKKVLGTHSGGNNTSHGSFFLVSTIIISIVNGTISPLSGYRRIWGSHLVFSSMPCLK